MRSGNTKNSPVQLHINKQEHDDIDNFHDEALEVADLKCT